MALFTPLDGCGSIMMERGQSRGLEGAVLGIPTVAAAEAASRLARAAQAVGNIGLDRGSEAAAAVTVVVVGAVVTAVVIAELTDVTEAGGHPCLSR